MAAATPFRLPGWATAPSAPPTLIVSKDGAEVSRTLLNNKALLFGRKVPNEPERGTLRLDHDSISREHAVIVHAFSGETFVCELGSRYGTKHNGEPLKAKVYTAIKEGDELQFGESTRRYIFYRHPPPPPRTGKEVRAPLSEPAAAASSSARAPALAAGADPPRPPPKPPPKPPPPMEEDEDPMANYVDEDEEDEDEDEE
jgi:nuclear inhibitor of protein phosphatase 1